MPSRDAVTRHDLLRGAIIDHYIEQGVVTATLGRLLQPRRERREPVKVAAQKFIALVGVAFWIWPVL